MVFDYNKQYDVAVAGAGIAGIAAALAAARRGHRTVLIEKQFLIGGLATSGLVYIYLPLCDSNGTQVVFGLAEELLHKSLEYSPFDLNEKWGGKIGGRTRRLDRFECDFSPAGFTLSLDKLLLEANVDLWLDTRVCAARQSSDGKVTALEVENASGRGVISAKHFVDATGEAIIVRRAGGKTFQPEHNFPTIWLLERAPGENLHYPFTDAIHMHSMIYTEEEAKLKNDPGTGKAATDFTRASWQMARDYYQKAYANGTSDRYNHYPLHLPAMPQLRKIARINGIETLTDNSEWQHFESSIGLYGDWRRSGKVYETPYGSLLPADVRGVLACGRCMSAEADAWESFRVIPAAAMTGEAAGTAAALAVEKNCDSSEITPETLRTELRKNNFKFYYEEAGLDPSAHK